MSKGVGLSLEKYKAINKKIKYLTKVLKNKQWEIVLNIWIQISMVCKSKCEGLYDNREINELIKTNQIDKDGWVK